MRRIIIMQDKGMNKKMWWHLSRSLSQCHFPSSFLVLFFFRFAICFYSESIPFDLEINYYTITSIWRRKARNDRAPDDIETRRILLYNNYKKELIGETNIIIINKHMPNFLSLLFSSMSFSIFIPRWLSHSFT